MNILNSTSNGLISSPSKWNGLNFIYIFLDTLRIVQKLTCPNKNFDTAVTRNALICSRNTSVNEQGGRALYCKVGSSSHGHVSNFFCLITKARQ